MRQLPTAINPMITSYLDAPAISNLSVTAQDIRRNVYPNETKQINDLAIWRGLFSTLNVFLDRIEDEDIVFAINQLFANFHILAKLGYGQRFSSAIMRELAGYLPLAKTGGTTKRFNIDDLIISILQLPGRQWTLVGLHKNILVHFIVEHNTPAKWSRMVRDLIDIDFFNDYVFDAGRGEDLRIGNDVWWLLDFIQQPSLPDVYVERLLNLLPTEDRRRIKNLIIYRLLSSTGLSMTKQRIAEKLKQLNLSEDDILDLNQFEGVEFEDFPKIQVKLEEILNDRLFDQPDLYHLRSVFTILQNLWKVEDDDEEDNDDEIIL